jgi:hypothetical protein
VTLTIEFTPEAQRMLDEADERWIGEHGFLVDNPLLNEIEHAATLLRANPELGVAYRRESFRREIRRLLLRSGWHLYLLLRREPKRARGGGRLVRFARKRSATLTW